MNQIHWLWNPRLANGTVKAYVKTSNRLPGNPRPENQIVLVSGYEPNSLAMEFDTGEWNCADLR